MKKKRIGSVLIEGFPFDVYASKKWPKDSEGKKSRAIIKYMKGEIIIKAGLKPHYFIETLGHEIFHEVTNALGIDINEQDTQAIMRSLYATGIIKAPPLGE